MGASINPLKARLLRFFPGFCLAIIILIEFIEVPLCAGVLQKGQEFFAISVQFALANAG